MNDIFLDSDGVMADFERGFWEQFGLQFHNTSAAKAWSLIRKTPDFYAKLPLMAGAEDIWHALRGKKVTVLTGCPSSGFDDAAAAKRQWWEKNFGPQVHVITCLSKDKYLHMRQPGDILIDDHVKNIDAWERANGVGFLHQNSDLTVVYISKME